MRQNHAYETYNRQHQAWQRIYRHRRNCPYWIFFPGKRIPWSKYEGSGLCQRDRRIYTDHWGAHVCIHHVWTLPVWRNTATPTHREAVWWWKEKAVPSEGSGIITKCTHPGWAYKRPGHINAMYTWRLPWLFPGHTHSCIPRQILSGQSYTQTVGVWWPRWYIPVWGWIHRLLHNPRIICKQCSHRSIIRWYKGRRNHCLWSRYRICRTK